MSVIYGIVMFNGQPVNQQVLDNMKSAMEFTKPDREALWVHGSVAIGSLIKFVAPESFKEAQPIFFEDNQKVMVVNARIDNRDDLCAVFNIPLIYRDNYPDSHYVRLAFEKWGEECCDHLLGDWSFAVYDKTIQKLYVARDHCGIMACYYYSCADFFAFSSSPKGLLALKEIPKEINEFRIAQILVAWPGDGEQTCYQNIFNLLPGHYLTIQNNTVQKHKFWELTEQEDLILPKEQDYYDRFLEIFTEAVRCRLRTTKQVGISLSGGLDSTSIAAIAAIELAKQNKELFAFTSVPLYKDYKVPKGRNGDEGELAGLMAKMYPNIRHFLVNAEGYDPIECIKKAVDIFDEPMHAAANQYWMMAINDKAKEFNCGVILNGQGGNASISWPTQKEKLKNQRSLKYYKHKLHITFSSAYRFLYKYELFKYPFLEFSDINLKWAEKFGLNELKEIKAKRSKLTFKNSQANFINDVNCNTNKFLFLKGLWNELDSNDPSIDKQLLNFLISIPQSLYKENKYEKIFIKKGLKELLPSEIIFYKKKGMQAIDVNNRTLQKMNNLFSEPTLINALKENEYSNENTRKSLRSYSVYVWLNKN